MPVCVPTDSGRKPQFAKAAGAKVIATTSSDKKAERLRSLGADHVVNYREMPDWGAAVAALTPDGAGVDLIVEVGGATTLKQVRSIEILSDSHSNADLGLPFARVLFLRFPPLSLPFFSLPFPR